MGSICTSISGFIEGSLAFPARSNGVIGRTSGPAIRDTKIEREPFRLTHVKQVWPAPPHLIAGQAGRNSQGFRPVFLPAPLGEAGSTRPIKKGGAPNGRRPHLPDPFANRPPPR